jgi:hypothetical protein
VIAIACSHAAACGDDDDDNHSHDGGGSSGGAAPAPTREVECTDQSVSQLVLFTAPSPAQIKEESKEGKTFHTFIDATGGVTGSRLDVTQSFVYAHFTDDGLKRVDIGDENAFTSLGWDIAFRRYLVRLNSGVSGPGEVTGARTAPNTEFASLDSVPEDLEYRTEEYFSPGECEFINDGSGLPGSPGTALSSYWTYSGCLKMSHNVYVVAVQYPKPRHVKLEVLSYYPPTKQAECESSSRVSSPSEAGNIRIRWAFLD